MAEGLVWPDRVVDVAEPVDLDGESVAVGDVGAVEVFVLEGAEEPFDDAVRLRDASATQQGSLGLAIQALDVKGSIRVGLSAVMEPRGRSTQVERRHRGADRPSGMREAIVFG